MPGAPGVDRFGSAGSPHSVNDRDLYPVFTAFGIVVDTIPKQLIQGGEVGSAARLNQPAFLGRAITLGPDDVTTTG